MAEGQSVTDERKRVIRLLILAVVTCAMAVLWVMILTGVLT